MFVGYRKGRRQTEAPGSVTSFVREELKNSGLDDPSRKAIRNWVQKWDRNNGEFKDAEDRAYTQKPRKLSPRVKRRVKERLEKLGSVKHAANTVFKNENGERMRLSRTSVAKVRDQFFKVKEPTNKKVILTAHHKKMRKLWALGQLAKFKKRKVFFFSLDISHSSIFELYAKKQLHSDESGFGLKVAPNKQNDFSYVRKGRNGAVKPCVKPWQVQSSDTKNLVNL